MYLFFCLISVENLGATRLGMDTFAIAHCLFSVLLIFLFDRFILSKVLTFIPFISNISRVPLGFVCGYPVGAGGELYGGSMFLPSAASDTLQGKAIQKVNEQWGSITSKSRRTGGWEGYQSIGIPVCKKKYKPFEFRVERRRKDGSVEIIVERMFGCHAHSNIRKGVIARHGERNGWVSNICFIYCKLKF